MTDYKRRIALGLMLLLYCFVLYLAFDFAFTALTMGDPRRYRIFDYRYHHSFWQDIRCIFWTVYKVVTHSQKLPKEIQEIVDDYVAEKQQNESKKD